MGKKGQEGFISSCVQREKEAREGELSSFPGSISKSGLEESMVQWKNVELVSGVLLPSSQPCDSG